MKSIKLLIGLTLMPLLLETENATNSLVSRGGGVTVNSDTSFDTMDLYKLSTTITTMEEKYNVAILSALSKVGTDLDTTATFDELINGIATSQDIDATNYVTTSANLSNNFAAWVDGEYIVGNGQDVKDAYNQGYADGKASVSTEARIEYEYHVHTGTTTASGGCYTIPVYHKHTGSSASGGGCYKNPVYCGERLTEGSGGYWHCHNYDGHDAAYHWFGQSNPDQGFGCPHIDYYTVTCGKSTSTIESYALGCGKTESTIEKAIIIYD